MGTKEDWTTLVTIACCFRSGAPGTVAGGVDRDWPVDLWNEPRASKAERMGEHWERKAWKVRQKAQRDASHAWALSGPKKAVMTPSRSSLLPKRMRQG